MAYRVANWRACKPSKRCEDASHSRSPAPADEPEYGSQRILREALSESDACSHRFLVQQRTLVSLVQFIFNTAT
jgi:hypothetical protein